VKAFVNGIQMGFEVIGTKGTPMVLIHGFGLDRTIWIDMVHQYLPEQHVILPDMRGHGESDVLEGAYRMSLMAKDILELLNFFGISKAIICGHSMGGYISLAFADLFPEKLLGLGLITTRAEADTQQKKSDRSELADKVRDQGTNVMAMSLAPKLSTDPKIIDRAHKILMRTDPRGVIGALQGMADRPDRTVVLDHLRQPGLVVAGEDDQIIPINEAQEMAGHLQNGEYLSIPGAGHMPMFEKPDILSEGLKNLIYRTEEFNS
jgi:pimeloyl-ACP methyl ester carboxylesterase